MPKVETSPFRGTLNQYYVSKALIGNDKFRFKRDLTDTPKRRVVKKLIRVEPINRNLTKFNNKEILQFTNSTNLEFNDKYVDRNEEYVGEPSDIPKNYHRKRIIVKKRTNNNNNNNNRRRVIVTKKRILNPSTKTVNTDIKPSRRVRVKKIKHTINSISEVFTKNETEIIVSNSTFTNIERPIQEFEGDFEKVNVEEIFDINDFDKFADDSRKSEVVMDRKLPMDSKISQSNEDHLIKVVGNSDFSEFFDSFNETEETTTENPETNSVEDIITSKLESITEVNSNHSTENFIEDESTENPVIDRPKPLPDYEPFFPELSESLDDPVILLKTTVLFSVENLTRVSVQSKLRTYTFVVTRVNGNEQIVTSTTEVKPHTKTITVTEPTTRFTTLTLLNLDTTETKPFIPMTVYPSMESSQQPNTQDEKGRAIEEARYNLATRVMSNGVEVIVAGDKSTLPGEPDVKRVLPSSIYKPVTLKPSTLTNNMMMMLPQDASNIESLSSSLYPNQFVTKTCLTTFTYLTTYLENGTTTVSSHEQVVSNIATEERNTGKILPTPTMGITLTQYPNLAVGTFVTTYTYLNTILDGEQPIVVTSKRIVSNTVTAPDDYLSLFQSNDASAVKDTNTYYSTVSLQKTMYEGKISKVVSTNEVVTQVVITESIPPKGTSVMTSYIALDFDDPEPQEAISTTDVVKTYFVTYTYYNTQVEDGSTVVNTNVSTSSDVVTEKLFLHSKKTKGGEKSVINTAPIVKDKKKNKVEVDLLNIFATKTYLTTFTYFTTLLQEDDGGTSTIISSHSRVVENIVTESIEPGQFDKKYLNSLKKEIKESGVGVTKLATLNDGQKIEITAVAKDKIKPTKVLPIEKTQMPEIPSTTPKIEPSTPNVVTGSTIIFVDDNDDPFALTTPSLKASPSKNALNSLLSSEIVKPQQSSAKRRNTKHKSTVNPTKPTNNQSTSKVNEGTKKKPGTKVVKPQSSVGNLLGSINIQALTPVLNAMAGLIQTNLKASRRNDSLTTTTPKPTTLEDEIVQSDGQNRSPIYIPVGGLSDIETAESQNIASWSVENQQKVVVGKPTHESPLLNGGIPISPGEVITANSDVIVGKPGRIGPRIPAIPLTHPDLNTVNPQAIQGMKPPPAPKSWPKRHSEPQVIHAPNKDDYIGPPPKIPIRPQNLVRNKKPSQPTIPINEQFHNPFLKPESLKPISLQDGLIVASNFHVRPSILNEPILPEVIERSTGQPLLVNIQPSQVAFVNIPHNRTTALIYGGSTEPHINGQYFDDPSPYPQPEFSAIENFNNGVPKFASIYNQQEVGGVIKVGTQPINNNPQVIPIGEIRPSRPLNLINGIRVDSNVNNHDVNVDVPPISFGMVHQGNDFNAHIINHESALNVERPNIPLHEFNSGEIPQHQQLNLNINEEYQGVSLKEVQTGENLAGVLRPPVENQYKEKRPETQFNFKRPVRPTPADFMIPPPPESYGTQQKIPLNHPNLHVIPNQINHRPINPINFANTIKPQYHPNVQHSNPISFPPQNPIIHLANNPISYPPVSHLPSPPPVQVPTKPVIQNYDEIIDHKEDDEANEAGEVIQESNSRPLVPGEVPIEVLRANISKVNQNTQFPHENEILSYKHIIKQPRPFNGPVVRPENQQTNQILHSNLDRPVIPVRNQVSNQSIGDQHYHQRPINRPNNYPSHVPHRPTLRPNNYKEIIQTGQDYHKFNQINYHGVNAVNHGVNGVSHGVSAVQVNKNYNGDGNHKDSVNQGFGVRPENHASNQINQQSGQNILVGHQEISQNHHKVIEESHLNVRNEGNLNVQQGEKENVQNIQNGQNIQNIQNSQHGHKTQNVQNSQHGQNIKNIQNSQHGQSLHNSEHGQNIQNSQHGHSNVQNSQHGQNIQQIQNSKIGQNIQHVHNTQYGHIHHHQQQENSKDDQPETIQQHSHHNHDKNNQNKNIQYGQPQVIQQEQTIKLNQDHKEQVIRTGNPPNFKDTAVPHITVVRPENHATNEINNKHVFGPFLHTNNPPNKPNDKNSNKQTHIPILRPGRPFSHQQPNYQESHIHQPSIGSNQIKTTPVETVTRPGTQHVNYKEVQHVRPVIQQGSKVKDPRIGNQNGELSNQARPGQINTWPNSQVNSGIQRPGGFTTHQIKYGQTGGPVVRPENQQTNQINHKESNVIIQSGPSIYANVFDYSTTARPANRPRPNVYRQRITSLPVDPRRTTARPLKATESQTEEPFNKLFTRPNSDTTNTHFGAQDVAQTVSTQRPKLHLNLGEVENKYDNITTISDMEIMKPPPKVPDVNMVPPKIEVFSPGSPILDLESQASTPKPYVPVDEVIGMTPPQPPNPTYSLEIDPPKIYELPTSTEITRPRRPGTRRTTTQPTTRKQQTYWQRPVNPLNYSEIHRNRTNEGVRWGDRPQTTTVSYVELQRKPTTEVEKDLSEEIYQRRRTRPQYTTLSYESSTATTSNRPPTTTKPQYANTITYEEFQRNRTVKPQIVNTLVYEDLPRNRTRLQYTNSNEFNRNKTNLQFTNPPRYGEPPRIRNKTRFTNPPIYDVTYKTRPEITTLVNKEESINYIETRPTSPWNYSRNRTRPSIYERVKTNYPQVTTEEVHTAQSEDIITRKVPNYFEIVREKTTVKAVENEGLKESDENLVKDVQVQPNVLEGILTFEESSVSSTENIPDILTQDYVELRSTTNKPTPVVTTEKRKEETIVGVETTTQSLGGKSDLELQESGHIPNPISGSELDKPSQTYKHTPVLPTGTVESVALDIPPKHHQPSSTKRRVVTSIFKRPINRDSKPILPTRYITHTKTSTVTITKTTVVKSLGSPPSTMTILVTKTEKSTIVDTVTEFHTLVKPTTIAETYTTTINQHSSLYPSDATYGNYNIQPTNVFNDVEPTEVEPTIVIEGTNQDDDLEDFIIRDEDSPVLEEPTNENESFFVVMTDKNQGSIVKIPKENRETQHRDEMLNTNEVNRVLLGGILIASPPSLETNIVSDKCLPECKATRNELCQKVDGIMRCVCRPGFARMFPDRPCKPTYTYTLKIGLERNGKEMLQFEDSLSSNLSPEFIKLAAATHEGLDRMVMQSDLRDIYHGVSVQSYEPIDGVEGVINTFNLQLSDNTDENRLQEVFKKYLRNNNYSLGGTEVFASKEILDKLEAGDFDECADPRYHDCSEFAQCFNLRGTYTCSCREGYADLSENILYPGRICSAEQVGCEKCHYHGTCYSRDDDQILCECFQWYAGESCQVNLKVLLIALVTLGAILFTLLLICIIITCARRKPKSHPMSFLPQRVPPRRGGTLDRRAMIQDTSSESGTDTLPYVPKKAPKGALKKPQKFDEKDRSLTVMIPRAKYHPAPPTSPHNANNFEKRKTSAASSNEAKLLSYLDAGPTPNKVDQRKYSRTSESYRDPAGSRKTSGALVSAGFEVSATVGGNNMGTLGTIATTCGTEADRSENATLIQKISADLLSSTGTQSQFTTLRKSIADTDEDVMDNWLDITPRIQTISESRSYDETTIQPPTKSLRNDYDSKSSQNHHDEANTMAERDLGSTFLLPHTHLYKPDRGSDISGFESL